MVNECPMCGMLASKTATVKSGKNWRDVVGKPPHSLFSEYVSICVVGQEVGGSIKIMLHTERDFKMSQER